MAAKAIVFGISLATVDSHRGSGEKKHQWEAFTVFVDPVENVPLSIRHAVRNHRPLDLPASGQIEIQTSGKETWQLRPLLGFDLR